jgi:hypothetical protein
MKEIFEEFTMTGRWPILGEDLAEADHCKCTEKTSHIEGNEFSNTL